MSTLPRQETSQPGSSASSFGLWLRVIVSFGLLALLTASIDFDETLSVLAGTDLLILAGALLVAFLIFFISGYRWYQLIRSNQHSLRFSQCLKLTFISNFLGLFLPGTIGVEAVRVYGMARATKATAGSMTSVFLDRFLAVFSQFLLAMAAILLSPTSVPQVVQTLAVLGLCAMLIGAGAMMNARFRKLSLALLPGRWLAKPRGFLEKIYTALDEYRGRTGLFAQAVVLALSMQIMRAVFYWIVALSVGLELPLVAFIMILPIVNIAALIPISIAGLGTREVVFVAMLSPFGVSAATAYAVSLLAFFIGAVVPALPGGVLYARSGFET